MANAFDLLKIYGAGWLGEARLACGNTAPFLPNGRIFKRIVRQESVSNAGTFGAQDLYAAFLLKTAADTYGVDSMGSQDSRRHTRFLYYMIVVDLVRGVLSRGRVPTTHHAVSGFLIRLFDAGKERAKETLLSKAIEIVGTYAIQAGEQRLLDAPAYKDRFYFDLAVRAICASDAKGQR